MDREDIESEIDELKNEFDDLETEIDELQAKLDDIDDPKGRKIETGCIENKILDRQDRLQQIEEEIKELENQLNR